MPQARTLSVKDEVIEVVRKLPGDCTLEDIQYHLYVHEQVDEAMTDIEQGRIVPHEEAKQRMKEWLKSLGLKKL